MLNGKAMTIHLIAGLIKKILYKMIRYFPKSNALFGRDINVKDDLCNYATKTHLKKATGVDTSKLAVKSVLASLKAEIDKIDLETIYDKLVAKVNNIDTSGFVLKTKQDIDKSDLEKKINHANIKYLILVDMFKKQNIMLKLLKLKVKYLVLVIQLLRLH